MWIGIAIVLGVIVTAALFVLAWRQGPQLSGDMRQWRHEMDALGRTAKRAPIGGPPPAPAEPDRPVDTVHVLGRDDA